MLTHSTDTVPTPAIETPQLVCHAQAKNKADDRFEREIRSVTKAMVGVTGQVCGVRIEVGLRPDIDW